jgi:hypothetical protein
MPDINYWIPGYGNGVVEPNPDWWSYWPHSQTAYLTIGDVYHSAWTECPNPNDPESQRAYSVLTKQTFIPIFGDGGAFYSASAGGSEPSTYLKRRDGVMRFGEKAVDYARDSLVYELPYLNPIYDYYLKVSSYRETGNDWTQALSVDGVTARSVRFAPGRVDTAWIKVPPVLYRQDRKVVFSLKKVRGDYVTSLGLTLYQRDPRRGKGGGQSGEAVSQPVREVFAVYPNPVKGQAQIEYSMKEPGVISLSIYDIMGRLVKTIVNDIKPAGVYHAAWDGRSQDGGRAPIGVYLLRLNASGVTKTAKVTLLR